MAWKGQNFLGEDQQHSMYWSTHEHQRGNWIPACLCWQESKQKYIECMRTLDWNFSKNRICQRGCYKHHDFHCFFFSSHLYMCWNICGSSHCLCIVSCGHQVVGSTRLANEFLVRQQWALIWVKLFYTIYNSWNFVPQQLLAASVLPWEINWFLLC